MRYRRWGRVLRRALSLSVAWAAHLGAQSAASAGAPTTVVYRRIAGQALRAFVYAPAPSRALRSAVVLFHGGGWTDGGPDWVEAAAAQFAASGIRAIAVDYRLADARTTPIEQAADACAALAWVRQHARRWQLDRREVALYGVSAGGQLAGLLAARGCGTRRAGPDAIVLLSPALDVATDAFFVGLLHGRARATAYSPVDRVRAPMPPVLIVHGDADSLTPLAGASRYCDAVHASGGRCTITVYPGLGHLLTRQLAEQTTTFDPDPVARAEALAAQVQFLRTLWPRR